MKLYVQENRRLEMELLDSREKLVDAEVQITKLQTTLDNVMKEKVERRMNRMINDYSAE